MLWVQVGMSGVGLFMALLVLPPRPSEPANRGAPSSFREAWSKLNPMPVFQVMKYPNVLLTVSNT